MKTSNDTKRLDLYEKRKAAINFLNQFEDEGEMFKFIVDSIMIYGFVEKTWEFASLLARIFALFPDTSLREDLLNTYKEQNDNY